MDVHIRDMDENVWRLARVFASAQQVSMADLVQTALLAYMRDVEAAKKAAQGDAESQLNGQVAVLAKELTEAILRKPDSSQR